MPNIFIHSGSGNDGISLLSWQNVVDGGTGSNFLVAGTRTDTFFVDARNPLADTWSTCANFHTDDSATLWGITAGVQALSWVDGMGAAGATGLTLLATQAGAPNVALTLAGPSSADLASGKLTASFGHNGGRDYLYLHAA